MTPQFLPQQPISQLVQDLSAADQDALLQRQVVITGISGEYLARLIVESPPQLAWDVLTDYDNFPRFLPNVSATDILTESDQRTVVEQTNTCQVLLANIESRICTENIELDAGKIKFRLLNGDLDQLQGFWQVLPLSDPADHVLLQQVVIADANIGILEGSFYSLFQATLRQNLEAIQTEINRRLRLASRTVA